jgi:predicted PurR-regulated permease PerM
MFFAVSPATYRNGIILLIPQKGKHSAKELINSIGTELTKWIKGKLFAMLVVFIMTVAGLLILGVPMPLALALLAGLLNFVPNFGPVIAMVPAILVSLPLGNTTTLLVAGLYIMVQVIESNFITPLVQQKLVKIPPALIITGQVVMGILTGMLGLLLATPIIIILMKTVQKLYITKQGGK